MRSGRRAAFCFLNLLDLLLYHLFIFKHLLGPSRRGLQLGLDEYGVIRRVERDVADAENRERFRREDKAGGCQGNGNAGGVFMVKRVVDYWAETLIYSVVGLILTPLMTRGRGERYLDGIVLRLSPAPASNPFCWAFWIAA
ncbi:hypothetical protein OH491_27620 (plasmid) [Termitidicoccus mucosus]